MIRPFLVLMALAPAQAGAFDIVFPVDCRPGDTCFIQQYVDHDAGPGARDFNCGPLSYDGHDGTDIAVPTTHDMLSGVSVRAAAAGRVLRVRTDVPDQTDASAPVQFPQGQDCGNGLVIDHGDGWESQYCHLRQGTTRLRPGDAVRANQEVGLVGQSGNAEFPHLHFTLRRDGVTVDPFAPRLRAGHCVLSEANPFWEDPVLYHPGGIIGIGFADHVPTFDQIKQGLPPPSLTSHAPALVVWAHVFGAQAGDALVFGITGPQGEVLADRVALERTQARLFRAVGRKLRANAWPEGTYTGTVRMMRGAKVLGTRTVTLDIGPAHTTP